MDSLIKWLGPGALVGGLGAAMLCGAGLASADTGTDAGPRERASQVSSAGAEQTARTARSGLSGLGPARPAAAQVRAARTEAAIAAPAAASTLASRASAAAVERRSVSTRRPAPAPAPAPVPVVASSVPVDPAQFAGTYYEQGSVKQFFSIGLVNTKAVYTVKPDGSLGVQNSGNYFFKRGPQSSITGSAVPVNAINTALNVGFGGTPSANPPGNYLIVDRAPDYSWVIVTDPSGSSGFILTRSQTIDPQTYQQLVERATALGVRGNITPTSQFP